GTITEQQATEILEEARTTKRPHTADDWARALGVTYAIRQELELTTIGATDVNWRQRKALRKERERQRQEEKRRAAGSKSYANSFARTQPWKVEKMSRRTWYYRRKLHPKVGSSSNEQSGFAPQRGQH